jgi:tetratricopeptide (TPR) repeat protein
MSNRANTRETFLEDRAVQLIDSGQFWRAESVLKRMLADDSNSLPAHFHLARVYRRTKQYRRALYHARRTLRLHPQEANACLNLGLIYEFMGNDRRAVFYYRKELSRIPNSAETLYNIGRLYFNRHRWLQASSYLARCLDVGFMHEIEDTVAKLGLCYYNLEDVQSYIRLHIRYLRRFPRAFWAAANLGRALLHVKDYKRALRWLSIASQRSENKKSVFSDLARARAMAANSRSHGRSKRIRGPAPQN